MSSYVYKLLYYAGRTDISEGEKLKIASQFLQEIYQATEAYKIADGGSVNDGTT